MSSPSLFFGMHNEKSSEKWILKKQIWAQGTETLDLSRPSIIGSIIENLFKGYFEMILIEEEAMKASGHQAWVQPIVPPKTSEIASWLVELHRNSNLIPTGPPKRRRLPAGWWNYIVIPT